MVQFLDGSVTTDYNGSIKFGKSTLVPGPGLMMSGNQIELDINIMDFMAVDIIKKEMQNCDLDIDQLNKMLEGSSDDREVAYELLNVKTKYVSELHRALEAHDSYGLQRVLRRYITNNTKLSKDIL